jgi:hypothetical protein
VVVSDDRLTARAYFQQELPATGAIEFGYGDAMLLRFSRTFAGAEVRRLDRERLPKGIRLLRRD